jgi:hypothetical protein
MRHRLVMRTTLDIDEDVLAAVKSLAVAQNSTAGKVISDLARQTLRPKGPVRKRNGFTLLPIKKLGGPVTLEIVNRLRDEE